MNHKSFQNRFSNARQNGNVLFVVLAGVALFAALVMSITRSDNTNTAAVMSQVEAKVHAAAIMRFGSDVEQAVQRLLSLHGCDITEISFERSPFDGSDTDYVNSNSPGDHSCHVFHSDGGQVEYITFEDAWKDDRYSSSIVYGDWFFSVMCLGPGSNPNCNTVSETERRGSLTLYAPIIKESICEAINIALLGDDTILFDQNSLLRVLAPFQGDYALNVPHLNIAAPNQNRIDGSMCVSVGGEPVTNSFNYYNVLINREDRFE